MSQSKLTLGLSLLLAAGFVFFGAQKFGAENIIFQTIAEKSGISFFEPTMRMITGVTELITAALLIIPKTRLYGALLGIAVLFGALVFHLSPWLGIVVPGVGPGIFFAAITMFILAMADFVLLRQERRA